MTNLRRKVKSAKKELKMLNQNPPRSTYEIIEAVKRKALLNELISHKTKPHIYNYKNVNQGLNYSDLTYLSIEVNMKQLLRKTSPNGKSFSEEEVDDFLELGLRKIINHANKVSKMSIEDKRPLLVDYVLYSSESRTKQKDIILNYLYKQKVGEDKLYPYKIKNGD